MAPHSRTSANDLPAGRLEERFPEHEPLLSAAEAGAEANRWPVLFRGALHRGVPHPH